MTTTTTAVPTGAAFRNGYAAARDAAVKADKALATAINHCEISPEIHQLAIEQTPTEYATVLRMIADIVATLPQLREDVQRANTIADSYAEFACWHCHGTGDYQGATGYYQNGRPTCWKCSGTGDNRHGK